MCKLSFFCRDHESRKIIFPDDILGKIKDSGFEIANAKEVSLTKEQAAHFYQEHADQDYFEKLVTHMSR